MPLHVHRLDSETHAHFLAEQRKDPITGEAFLAGDTVVCCACCGSAFELGSWEYLGGKHCDQQETLPELRPALPLQLGAKKTEEELALYASAPWHSRTAAFLLDVLVLFCLNWLFTPLGFVYFICKDGLPGGQSLGKRVMGLMVIQPREGTPATVLESFFRGLPFTLLCLFPLLSELMFSLFCLGLFAEALGAYRYPQKLGDLLAATQVIEKSKQRQVYVW